MTVYYIRHLPPKTNGLGSIVHSVCSQDDLTIRQYKDRFPEAFVSSGFYTLLKSTDEILTLSDEEKK